MVIVLWGTALKIGLPKLRLSRKLLFVALGMTVLLGGTGVTALYFGGKVLILEGGENALGGECTDVQTMVVKTPSNHLWLRRFIRMENAGGQDRVRTALRIAGLLAKKHAVDLIHVSVLDAHGPTKRSEMRARAIGAEVLIAMKPENLPEMKAPAMASFYEGSASEQGRYYGDKVVVDLDEIGAMMTAMRTVDDKPDCIDANAQSEASKKKDDQGKKDGNDGQQAKGKSDGKPEGEQPANAHGEEPAKNEGSENTHAEEPAKEESFVEGMLKLVGLGGSDEKPATDHTPAADNSHAVAEEPADGHQAAARPDGDTADMPVEASHTAHTDNPAGEQHPQAADHGEKDAAADRQPVEQAPGHDTANKASANHDAAPASQDDKRAGDDADKAKRKQAKADEHAGAYMPVGD